jgi:hypothetical protein
MIEFGSLPLRAFSPKFGKGPFSYGMTLHKGGNVFEDIGGAVSDAGQSVANVVSDVGTSIDNAVIQPAIDDPAGTVVKIGAIAAAPVTGGASLYAIPAYTAAKAIAAGVPLEDAAKMTAISAAAAYAGVSVADYVGTLAEFGTDIGSQQTAMLAAQNVGIGTGNVASTAAGQIAGGAAGGALVSGATGGDIGQGLLSGATSGAVGAGVGAAVDAGAGLFNNIASQTNTGSTKMDEFYNTTPVYDFSTLLNPVASTNAPMEDWLAQSGYYDNPANIGTYTPPTASDFSTVNYGQNSGDVEAQAGGYYGGAAPVNPYTNMSDAELTAALANTPSFIGSGGNSSTAMNLLKQYGSAAVKALLGGAGSAAQRATFGLGPSQAQGGGLLSAAGNYLLSANQLSGLRNAYAQNVAGQQQATQQAVSQAGFTPVGTTTAFGQSNFGFDPVTGKLTSAGYTATPELASQRQRLFGMGVQALPTTADTQAIQQQYIAQQQGLLAPSREQKLAQLENKQYQTGRTGLATGGTMAGYAPGQAGLMQTNPELAAYYNSLAQQDAQLVANAPTYAQNQLNAQIATGTGLFGAANTLEGYAQQPLALSSALGTAASTAGAKAGYYGLLGNQSALQTQLLGQQQNIYGTGQAIGSAVNPLLTAAQGGLNTAIGNWLA